MSHESTPREIKGDLFHYTDWGGLEGIWDSNKIWATRFDCLNDSSEMTHLGQILTSSVSEKIRCRLIEGMRDSLKIKQLVKRAGGVQHIAKADSTSCVSVLTNAVLGKGNSPGLATPYVASFCTHDQEYEQNNGLLSQWRGYGGAGYAIVIDRDKLIDAIDEERNSFAYQAIFLNDVVYDAGYSRTLELFSPLVEEISEMWFHALFGAKTIDLSELFHDFLLESTCFKHRGFMEEREVRIVCAPLTKLVLEAFRMDKPDYDPGRPIKQPLSRVGRNDRPTHYVELFSTRSKSLPITRIIVGPGLDQIARFEKANDLVRDRVPVAISQTPFIG